MHFNKLDLNLLVALDAMLTERSISRAAARVHISQSAMSNALARLRDYFGDELLIQVGRKMELSPRAESLQFPVRDVLVRVESSITTQPQFDPRKSERMFKICLSDYTLHTLIPHVLALAHEQGSSVRFQFLPQVDNPQRELERGETDLLVIPEMFCSDTLPSELLFSDGFCCAVWDQGQFAHGAMTMERFVAAGHVVMQPPHGHPSYETKFLLERGIVRTIEVATFSFATTPSLLVGTDRIATLHQCAAQLAQAHFPLKLLPTPVEIPPMRQKMQWHSYKTNDLGLIWLRKLFHQAARRMIPDTA